MSRELKLYGVGEILINDTLSVYYIHFKIKYSEMAIKLLMDGGLRDYVRSFTAPNGQTYIRIKCTTTSSSAHAVRVNNYCKAKQEIDARLSRQKYNSISSRWMK